MDIKHQIGLKLKEFQADNLPAAVLHSIETEVLDWERELNDSARKLLSARIERRVTKPFIARHFTYEFRRRKSSIQEGI